MSDSLKNTAQAPLGDDPITTQLVAALEGLLGAPTEEDREELRVGLEFLSSNPDSALGIAALDALDAYYNSLINKG